MFVTESFGAAVAAARRALDLSQYALADEADITRKTLDRIERGADMPAPDALLRLCRALRVEAPKLLADAGATPEEIALYTGAGASADALVSAAPTLPPSTLDAAARALARHGIDISAIVELSRYLNADTTAALLADADYDAMNPEMLEHLMPLLDAPAREIIFRKILDGELDYHLIACMLPYSEYLIQQVEAAVVYGVLDEGALRIVNAYMEREDKAGR